MGFVDELEEIEVAELAVRGGLEHCARGAEQGSVDIGAGEEHRDQSGAQQQQYYAISNDARGHLKRLAFFNSIQRREADQTMWTFDLFHYLITGIDTSGAVDAFHLGAVADVNPGGAHGDAVFAVNAVTELFSTALLDCFAATIAAPVLAPFVIISDDDCVFIPARGNPRSWLPAVGPSRAPAAPQASAQSSVDLDAAGGQAISACGGDARKTLKGLITANDFLRN